MDARHYVILACTTHIGECVPIIRTHSIEHDERTCGDS
jgi:hypothetical protein